MNFLSKERTVAGPGFSRWMVPPAALCIHLSIGQAYALSVFNLPMTRLIGISKPVEGDWQLTELGWIFSLAIFFLGLSAALFGRWVEEGGPRRAMLAAAAFWSAGFFVSALGVHLHQLVLVYFGYGVLGGIGLGLGYISPVSTLIKWFPDRPGMATGMAIMGFGGGAFIASPLSVRLINHFSNDSHVGVAEAFIGLGLIYLTFMLVGTALVRVPPPDWKPPGWTPSNQSSGFNPARSMHVHVAWKTPQFWCIWVALCMNVTAGIGVLGQASAMSQEMFQLSASAAAGFVGILSLANMLGRFFWASLSDLIGRKNTYLCFFAIGLLLYAFVPYTESIGSVGLFVVCFVVIMSMYGGGFATVPAYLRDLFGTNHVGAIHGRLLTAWSLAGILGPVLVNYIRKYQIDHGVAAAQAYNTTMYLMAGLLIIGLFANAMVRPLEEHGSDATGETT